MEFCDKFWQFIKDNKQSDVNKLRLKYHSSKNISFDIEFAITQIDSRQRCIHKLPTILKNENFIFPSKLSSEQSTSEQLALFHSMQLQENKTLLDMTCGLGIDVIYSSKRCKEVTAIDINPQTVSCLSHNISVLGIDNVSVINDNSIKYLSNIGNKFDIIFIDPARRTSDNKRAFALEDCEPNVVEHIDIIKNKCSMLYIKVSPMLDITKIINSLNDITDVWILSIKNECKEVFVKCLFDCKVEAQNSDKIYIHAVDLDSKNNFNEFVYQWKTDVLNHIEYVNSLDEISNKWIYEPNSSMMKCGCWKELLSKYPLLRKLHVNTHLFVSEEYYADFPGRVKKVVNVISGKSKELKGKYYNIVTRNYPKGVDQIKKEFGVVDGGNQFMYCFRYGKDKSATLIAE